MNMRKRLPAWVPHLAVGSFLVAGWLPAGQAQTTRPATDSGRTEAGERAAGSGRVIGIVTGDRVNVRSGSDRNYYPVTHLNMGDQVVVVGDEYGWLEILPPAGTYSLIEKTYVTREPGSREGSVNETVWVVAGSDMSTRRYARQVKLGRGDKVTILGETEDGDFFKITPPKGATHWISGDFVDVKGGTAAAEGPSAPTLEPVRPGELLTTDVQPAVERPAAESPTTREASTTITRTAEGGTRIETIERTRSTAPEPSAFQSKHQIEIKALEAEITAEATKPLQDQNYDPVLDRLMALAEKEDEVTRRYAESRLKQIRMHIELINTLGEVENLTASAITEANRRQRERSTIQVEETISLDHIVVQGVIEVSSIYRGSESRPQRWRIVDLPDPDARIRDAQAIAPKTLAYLEVAEGSSIDLMEYIGKHVGVRASKRRYIRDAIPPIPIYTVEQVVPMSRMNSPRAPSTRPAGSGASEPAEQTRSNRAVVASPESARIAPPRAESDGAMKPATTGDPETE